MVIKILVILINYKRYFTLLGLILCLEVRESHSCFHFLKSCFFFYLYFAHDPIEYEKFSNRLNWPIDWILTGATTVWQSGSGSNGNEGYSTLFSAPESSVSPSAAVWWHIIDTLLCECPYTSPGILLTGQMLYWVKLRKFILMICIP